MSSIFRTKKLLSKIGRQFWRDEKAQSTFEYILMLSIAVTLTILVIKTLIVPVLSFLSDQVSGVLRRTLFNKPSMHHIRVR